MVKYLGSKRMLLPAILDAVESIAGARTVLDLFSGTSRVGHALKARGYRVIANDHNAYAHVLAMCYVQADAGEVLEEAQGVIGELNGLVRTEDSGLRTEDSALSTQSSARNSPGPDPFTATYCIASRFFHPLNGPRIFAVREEIARRGLRPEVEAVVLTSLLEAADRVDSTTGVQMAYLKEWAPRALKPLQLRVPRVLPRAAAGKGLAQNLDAVDAARRWGRDADIAYIDPPYNQHSYLGNYHIWETLVRWDFPAVYGRACKREDCRTRGSAFNSRRGCLGAFEALLEAMETPNLIVSFSNEGFLTREQMEGMLAARGRVRTVAIDHKRYVGAQIGIYNPRGEKVGRVSHLRNTEYLFIVTPEQERREGRRSDSCDGLAWRCDGR